jgi:hypothetical protein
MGLPAHVPRLQKGIVPIKTRRHIPLDAVNGRRMPIFFARIGNTKVLAIMARSRRCDRSDMGARVQRLKRKSRSVRKRACLASEGRSEGAVVRIIGLSMVKSQGEAGI